MKSSTPGKSISCVEIQNISQNGIWILVKDKEYFMPYTEYPWFKEANVSDICNVELLHESHLHWPNLDVDLELASLQALENYPLIYR
jgi:hypothetical protein